jgi:hypothetical protein
MTTSNEFIVYLFCYIFINVLQNYELSFLFKFINILLRYHTATHLLSYKQYDFHTKVLKLRPQLYF